MLYIIIFMFMLLNPIQDCLGFNIIPLDKALIEHQKAFKDFEQYVSTCKADFCVYGNITEYNYEFPSIQAKKTFNNYKNKYNNLNAKIYNNLLLRGFIMGLLTTFHDNFFNKKFFNKESWYVNFATTLAMLIYDNTSRPKEPYIGLGSFKKYENLFELNDLDNLNKIVIILTFCLVGRWAGEFIPAKY